MPRLPWCACLLLAVLADPLSAQSARIQLTDSAGRPVAGALVTVLDESGRPLRALVSDAAGGIGAGAADTGRLVLRVERPGYLPFTSRPFSLQAGAAGLRVDALRRTLPEPRSAGGDCVPGSVFEPAAEWWQQAGLALRIMALAEESRMLDVRGGRYVRVLDGSGRVQQGVVDREPFAGWSVPYPGPRTSQLPETGLAVRDSAGSLAYLIPAPAMLASPSFLRGHCVNRVVTERSRRDQVGLGFRPAPGSSVAAAEGVLWLDRDTGEPRSVAYEYRDETGMVPRGTRGLVGFGAGREGLPQVVRWWVRVPQVFEAGRPGAGTERISNIVESGAFVLDAADRPVEDPDGVFAALGEVFRIDPILVEGERAQRATTAEGTRHIAPEDLVGGPSTHGWDIVRLLRPNWVRRSESIGLSDASSAGGLSFVVYLDRMRISCLMGDTRPQGQRFQRSVVPGLSDAPPGQGGGQCLTPEAALTSISAAEIASIEYVPPVEAGAIYGMGHGYGVVVIHTRRR